MKITHIIAIVVVAAAISIITMSFGDTSQYVGFGEAKEMADDGNDNKVHVVGELPRNSTGEVSGIIYDPLKDPNYMAFTLIDEDKNKQKVVTFNPPSAMQDFKRSEKVVIIGRYEGEDFIASEILMKCPSKYEEKEIKVTDNSQANVAY